MSSTAFEDSAPRSARPGGVTIHLRPATAADADAVATLMIGSRLALMPFAPSAHNEQSQRQWIAGHLIPQGGVTVAELRGQVVGMLALQCRKGMGWIDQLMVDPLHVKRGIG